MRRTSLKILTALKYQVLALRGLYEKSRILNAMSGIGCAYVLKAGGREREKL
ncbi:hypothetical protein GBAR_LOCUS3664 [Geodia barretti]|uniref:Uncharacterized protein n=1 Tax=Geodia barretti TaxID=519541 RepID=A0AA35R4V1_GEOBA|nr:hypothetical protein GBAR_LOCUS3664 [Geodia barretti]